MTAANIDGCSVGINSTKYIAIVLKKGTSFGPTAFNYKQKKDGQAINTSINLIIQQISK